jgi:hypothetical protein
LYKVCRERDVFLNLGYIESFCTHQGINPIHYVSIEIGVVYVIEVGCINKTRQVHNGVTISCQTRPFTVKKHFFIIINY